MSVHELMMLFRRTRGSQAHPQAIEALKKLDDVEARGLNILINNMLQDTKMQEKQAAQRRFLGGRMP